jgi:hypothetical protein
MTMTLVAQAVEILRRAEREMQSLISEAAAAGQYEEIPALAALALRISSSSTANGQGDGTVVSEHSSELGANHTSDAMDEIGSVPVAVAVDEPGRIESASGRTKYPCFYRQGGKLVKIGWSKNSQGEYEHKAGRAVVDAVVAAVLKATAKRARFDIEELGTVHLDAQRSPVPSYQLYLVVAWLRSAGLIAHVGRRHYQLGGTRGNITNRVKQEWNTLEER